jgi:hypothetical protein
MARADSWGLTAAALEPAPVLASYHEGVSAVCALAARLRGPDWNAPTPCAEWRAADLAGHLRCVADDYHEYLDHAPASRLARLMAAGPRPDTLERKLARQNAAELAALPDVPPAEHVAAFAVSAREYASRLPAVWDLPHHHYREIVVTVAAMAGAACAEWHLHAWDLARSAGLEHQPAEPALVLAGWRAGMPQLQAAGRDPSRRAARGRTRGRLPSLPWAGQRPAAPRGPRSLAPAGRLRVLLHVDRQRECTDPWHTLLLASGRSPQ